MAKRPLAGYRVVDLTVERGEMSGRLLSDLGADTIKVEAPGGSPARAMAPMAGDHSLFFTYRNAGKRSVTLDLGDTADRSRLHELLATADAVITSTEPGQAAAADLEPAALGQRHPHLVVAAITAYGLTGPYAGRDVPDAVIEATGGMAWKAGTPDRAPLLPPGNIGDDTASLIAAFAITTAWWQAVDGGAGQVIDVSANESLAQITDWTLSNDTRTIASGSIPGTTRNGPGPVYTILPCKNGYVRLVVLSPRQWHAMRAWLGEPEYLQDPELDSFIGRFGIADAVLNPLYEALFADMDMQELSAEAQRRGIVCTPILKPDDVLTNSHFASRNTFDQIESPDGTTWQLPSGFFEIDGERVGPTGRPPEPGQHSDEVFAALGDARPAPDTPLAKAPPLADIRVLDFGHGGVGVEAGRMLAEYGADVIKIESRTYPDFIRVVLGGEMSPSFASSSRSKRSFGVDAKTDRGRALLLELARSGDIVIENNSTGTMDKLGLGFGEFNKSNSDLVMVSSQLMGSRGEWADWLGYGPNTQVTGGMTHLWNYANTERPAGSQSIFPDHYAGRMCALAALAGRLGARKGTIDQGVHVEVCQVEQVVGVMGDLLARESIIAGSVVPMGNRSERGAPWGLYTAAGDDQWLAVCCRSDADWMNLRKLIGLDEDQFTPELDADVELRRAAHDEIDAAINAWTSTCDKYAAAEELLAGGVPAGPMLTGVDQVNDPHFAARGYVVELDQPPLGLMSFEGAAFQGTAMVGPDIRPAPGLGAHTREVATDLLGLDPAEVDKLIEASVLEIDTTQSP